MWSEKKDKIFQKKGSLFEPIRDLTMELLRACLGKRD